MTGRVQVLAILMSCSVAGAGTFEESRLAASFLKIGTGARASAMGEAFTSVADDASALLWNPAGLSMVRKVELQVTHNQWVSQMKVESFCLAFPAAGTWGLAYTLGSLGDFADWNGPGEPLGGTFSVNEQVFSAGYGNIFFADSISLGATGRVVKEDLGDGFGGQTYSMDLGVMVQPWWAMPGVNFSAVIQNMGGELTGFELPMGVRAGVSWRRPNVFAEAGPVDPAEPEPDVRRAGYPWEKRDMKGDLLTLSAEALVPRVGRAEFHIGTEYWLHFVAIRAGYRYRYPRNELGGSSGLTLGLGIRGHSFQFDYGFDYAYSPYGDLGDASRFSLLVAF